MNYLNLIIIIEEKLKSLGIELPHPPKPAGSYVPVSIIKDLVYVSGQIPILDGKVRYTGKIPTERTVEEGQYSAKLCAINALSQLKAKIEDLDHIAKIVRVSGFVNSSTDFTDHAKVIDGASDFLYQVFAEKDVHTRIAVGVSSLPLDATTEIDMILELS